MLEFCICTIVLGGVSNTAVGPLLHVILSSDVDCIGNAMATTI